MIAIIDILANKVGDTKESNEDMTRLLPKDKDKGVNFKVFITINCNLYDMNYKLMMILKLLLIRPTSMCSSRAPKAARPARSGCVRTTRFRT